MRRVGTLIVAVLMCGGALAAGITPSQTSAAQSHAVSTRGAHGQVGLDTQSRSTNALSRAASVDCFDAFGQDAGPQGGDGCVSLIRDGAGYCLSSADGHDSTYVRQQPCNDSNDAEIWWVTPTGVNGTFEIWSAGSSCPKSMAWDSCGTPYGPQPQGNGYCLSVKGVVARARKNLVMWGCKQGGGYSTSFEGMGQVGAAWIRYIGSNPRGQAFCVGTLGHRQPGKTVGLGRCANTSQQLFTGGTLGDKLVTVTPPF
jgi:hypothetical protein